MLTIISIITPSLNQAEFLSHTIESVLSQKGDFYIDYVIIDGGSTDGSKEIILKYESALKEHCNIKKIAGLGFFIPSKPFHLNRCNGISYRWISEKDNSHGHALNKGFGLTVGDIMGWINSDDIYLENAFANVVGVFSQLANVKWLTGLNRHMNKDGAIRETSHLTVHNYKNIYSFLTDDYEFIQQESTLWKRDLWEKAGSFINTEYRFMVDGELWCRFFLHEELYHLNRDIGAFRWYDSNRSSSFIDQVKDELKTAVKWLGKKAPPGTVRIARALIENAPVVEFDHGKLNFKIIDKGAQDIVWQIHEVDFLLYSLKRNAMRRKSLLKNIEQQVSKNNH